MLFTAHEPDDGMDEATLRRLALHTIGRVHRIRDVWMSMCENRDHLRNLDIDEQKARFGVFMLGAIALARNDLVPGPAPEALLDALSDEARTLSPIGKMVEAMRRDGRHRAREAALNAVTSMVATIPGFNREAAASGEPQSDDFMFEYALDFPTIRELAFEFRKPLQFTQYAEGDFVKMSRIRQQFNDACFAGIDIDRVSELITDHPEVEPDPDLQA